MKTLLVMLLRRLQSSILPVLTYCCAPRHHASKPWEWMEDRTRWLRRLRAHATTQGLELAAGQPMNCPLGKV